MPSELSDDGLHQQHRHGANLRRDHGQKEGWHRKEETHGQLHLQRANFPTIGCMDVISRGLPRNRLQTRFERRRAWYAGDGFDQLPDAGLRLCRVKPDLNLGFREVTFGRQYERQCA
jgi:hypothetical protein